MMVRGIAVATMLGVCAQAAAQVNTTLDVAALKTSGITVSRPGIQIAVRPVSYTELSRYKGLLIKVAWAEVDKAQVHTMGSDRGESGEAQRQKTGYGIAPVMPMPMFIVRIVNHSGKPLEFGKATLQLVDDKGKHYEPYSDGGELSGRVVGDITIRFPQLQDQPAQFDHVREVITKANLLDKHTTIRDGADWQGYLAFKLEARTASEVDKFLQAAGKMTVQLTNIGGDSKLTSIEIALDKVTAPLAVSCPADKPKSMAVCKPQPIGE